MSEASLLPSLVSLATFLLAVNLAYLRFETFDHRTRIREHAAEKLGTVRDVPDKLKQSDYYKRLSFWAGISQNSEAVSAQLGWAKWYPHVFDSQRDRWKSKVMVWSALPVVLVGTADVSGQIQIPAQAEWIGWLLLTLEFMTVGSVVLVLAGNDYISRARTLIDKDAEQWTIFMRDRTSAARPRQTRRSVPPSSIGGRLRH